MGKSKINYSNKETDKAIKRFAKGVIMLYFLILLVQELNPNVPVVKDVKIDLLTEELNISPTEVEFTYTIEHNLILYTTSKGDYIAKFVDSDSGKLRLEYLRKTSK
jgi:hypothetical protein